MMTQCLRFDVRLPALLVCAVLLSACSLFEDPPEQGVTSKELPAPTGQQPEETAETPSLDLRDYERRVYSQFGEDGVIERIFELIEPSSKFAVEFGAADGIKGSNVRRLIVEEGWSSFQIEGNPELAAKLHAGYAENPRVKTLEAWVFPGNIEILFEDNGVPPDLDLLVIDIDSNDYYIWKVIHNFRPKVVQIEFNPFYPPPELMVIDFHPMNYWDNSSYVGASVETLDRLAKKKGYELVYIMSDGPNAFFVDAKYFPLFGIEDNSPSAIWRRKWSKEELHQFRDGWESSQPLEVDAFQIEKKIVTHR